MTTKKTSLPRGRPRRFNPEDAIATAQSLFHARGYDAVSVSDVTDVLGINPPSFYAAFGNKAGLYARALDRYAVTNAIPFQQLLTHDKPVAECLASVLEEAARRYVADPVTAGCLVLEGARCDDMEARQAAGAFQTAAEDMLRDFIAERYPDDAERLTDFVSTTMVGLSTKARQGHNLDRVLSTARLASQAIAASLSDYK